MEQLTTLERKGGEGSRSGEFFNVAPFKTGRFVKIEQADDYSIRINESKCTANVSYKGAAIGFFKNDCLVDLIVSAYEAVDNHSDAIVMEIDLHHIEG